MMVTRNIVIGGMTGGASHVGMVTQGYGGVVGYVVSISVYLTPVNVITGLTGVEVVVGLTPVEVEAGLTSDEVKASLTADEVLVRLR